LSYSGQESIAAHVHAFVPAGNSCAIVSIANIDPAVNMKPSA